MAAPKWAMRYADVSMTSPGGSVQLTSVVGSADVSVDWSIVKGSVGSTGHMGPLVHTVADRRGRVVGLKRILGWLSGPLALLTFLGRHRAPLDGFGPKSA
jgi:hypothetical protein